MMSGVLPEGFGLYRKVVDEEVHTDLDLLVTSVEEPVRVLQVGAGPTIGINNQVGAPWDLRVQKNLRGDAVECYATDRLPTNLFPQPDPQDRDFDLVMFNVTARDANGILHTVYLKILECEVEPEIFSGLC